MDYTALIHGVTELVAQASRHGRLEARLDEARALSRHGRLSDALDAYQGILRTHKNHPGAWHEAALIHLQLGDIASAASSLIESLRLEPWRVRAHHDLGRIVNRPGAEAARAGYFSLFALPDTLGPDLSGALAECAAALATSSTLDNYLRLAHLQIANLQVADGVDTLRTADAAGFQNATVAGSLAEGYALLGLDRDAETWRAHACYLSHEYQQAVDRYAPLADAGPADALIHARLAASLGALHRFPDAIGVCETGARLHPEDETLACVLAELLHADGQLEASRRSAAAAAIRFPANLRLKQLALLSLPIVYETAAEITRQRTEFAKGLDDLMQHILTDASPVSRTRAHGLGTNFLLAYQGGDDRELQMQFATLLHHAAWARDPQWSRPLPLPALKPDERLRVGYVSANLYRHTVAKLFLGWLQDREPDRTEVYVYHLGTRLDAMTQQYQRAADHFRQIQGDGSTIARQIVEDRIHVLVYLDVGMDDLTTQLAALYLAPVQCAAWGHPVTTGLRTIDYFISSESMEPDDADRHYSERLVRLPGIGVSVPPPYLEQPHKGRAAFGLSNDDCVFLTPQSAFKYLPQHDGLFCRIAARVPNAKFVFLRAASENVTNLLTRRLMAAFDQHGLDGRRFLVFLPHQHHRDYLDLNIASDVFLDQPGWSGGMTGLEAIGCGLPIVTWPGPFMRGRHSLAFLRAMQLDDLIAGDLDAYVQIAVRLGVDSAWRDQQRREVAARRHRVFNDSSWRPTLDRFYLDALSIRGT